VSAEDSVVNQARPFDRRLEPLRSERVRVAKVELAGRLRGVCAHLTAADFDALLERMVTLEIKYAQRAHENLMGLRDAIDANRKPRPSR
jgi:hypothetical protein